jgi:[protein-PII] uridylyltransferase
MGYKEADVDSVSALVEDHLLLSKIATRRDLNDEETAIYCARRVKDTRQLKMLYLLTVADSMATGPKAWNEWTSVLLKELFLKTLSVLERGELASQEAVEVVKGKQAGIVESAETPEERKAMEQIFKAMSPRYLLYMPIRFIRDHIALFNRLKDKSFVWDVKMEEGSDIRTVIICAKDRPGLFSKIAGVFTLNGVDILDAQIFTWRNGIALDIFEVKPPPDRLFEEERWLKAEENLRSALEGELDVPGELQHKLRGRAIQKSRFSQIPDRVVVDNDTSSFFSIVEVFTYDFPGLLFSITDALYRCGLDIWVAKIATKIDQVVDVFYVRDLHGHKITEPEKVAEIKSTVLGVLPGSEEPGN